MPDESPLLRSLRAAIAAAPGDVPLRLHFAELLLAEGRNDEAVTEAAVALQHAPGDEAARALMVRAMGAPAPGPAPAPAPAPPEESEGPAPFDWAAAEQEVGDLVGPRFVESGTESGTESGSQSGTGSGIEEPLTADGSGDPGDASAWDVDAPGSVRLADVGGMQEVKDRLEAAFLAPMRNPELRKLYGKSLRGGLLLYGPPGCGKTFIARAVAGELGASFMSISLSDILDMYIGTSEKNVHDIFETARRQAPCVVFLDELDALGAKRSRTHHSGLRNVVNQLLTELDGINGAENEGVFVLAATNVPWDVDLALRRPGRLDRTLLVLPPDGPAREAILRYHLRERPIESVDLGKLVKATEDFSGADLAHLCETAAESALLDSARTGTVRMINMKDLLGAAKQLRPSSESWFASARNVAMFANDGGMYDDLVAYLKKKRKL
ncbi:tetratricopeptide repeat protein [Streptomyces sp. ISL-36]|uniref:tetratricopeptide repeat protein n=1 Tax=Streptomyces sp. ISL-36 TaxID=2819182 RepID=UPI001BE710E5|nr:tetratricopeptide repeat protein [Streptomyces sp. ISL-36]MBT2439289.1 tetratricopeptide repeat protein [Streptomyces sp. ISL-36]